MSFEKLRARWDRERKQRIAEAEARRRAIAEVAPPLFQRYGVRKAVLFDSAAFGSSTKSSDIDLLVIPPAQERYWQFRRELQEVLGYDLDLFTQADDPDFVEKVLKRGEVIFYAEQ